MYKDTFSLADSLFYEIKDSVFLWLHIHFSPLTMRKDNLVFRIHPIQIEIDDSDAFPVIWDFFARTIYHVRHLISHYKFQVLQTEIIRNSISLPRQQIHLQ